MGERVNHLLGPVRFWRWIFFD